MVYRFMLMTCVFCRVKKIVEPLDLCVVQQICMMCVFSSLLLRYLYCFISVENSSTVLNFEFAFWGRDLCFCGVVD